MIEVLIALALAGVALSAVFQFSALMGRAYVEDRQRAAAHANLALAREQIRAMLQPLEPGFWDAHPRRPGLLHATDGERGAMAWADACPLATSSGCFTLFDLHPPSGEPVLYRVEYHDFPAYTSITPTDPSIPIGPGEDIARGCVLLFKSPTRTFCALVADTAGNHVYLEPPGIQPWLLPSEWDDGQEHLVVNLGTLTATHCRLTPDAERHNRLHIQPWEASDGGWSRGHAWTSYGFFESLAVSPPEEQAAAQIRLIAKPQPAIPLARPLEIAGRAYHEEVYLGAVYF